MVIARKLDRAEREFRTPQSKVRKFSHRAKPPPGTRVPFRTPQAKFRTVRIKVRKFRTPLFKVRNSFQGAKFSVQGANSLNISFAHHYSRCKNFRTVRETLLAYKWHFAHPKPIFTPCETRCEFLSPKYGNFARCNSRCEILILRCEYFATVGHVFGALPGAQIMHMICNFKALEVRNPVLQTVHDLDLKQRSYGHLKTTMQS